MPDAKSRYAGILTARGFAPMKIVRQGTASDFAARAHDAEPHREPPPPAKHYKLMRSNGPCFITVGEEDSVATFAWDEVGGLWFKAGEDDLTAIGFLPVPVVEENSGTLLH